MTEYSQEDREVWTKGLRTAKVKEESMQETPINILAVMEEG